MVEAVDVRALVRHPSWISSVSTAQVDVYKTTEYDAQWGLNRINAAKAYALLAANSKTVAGSGVKIGIVDTGVQMVLSHLQPKPKFPLFSPFE